MSLMTNYRTQILKFSSTCKFLQHISQQLHPPWGWKTKPPPKKTGPLRWKYSIHIRTYVAVSEALIRLRNPILPRHHFTHIEQKPASVCQGMTKLAAECACMGFRLPRRDQLCSERRSWCKRVTWMGLRHWRGSSVASALIILCCLVPACLCSQKVTLTQFVLQQTKLKLKGHY